MKKTFFMLLIFCFCAALRADLLDDVARQLDLLEKEYWLAQRNPSGEYYRTVSKRLGKFRSNMYRIVDQLRKLRKQRLVQFDQALNVLNNNYGKMKPAVVQAFRFNMKSTAMSEYTRAYREFLREKKETEEETQEEGKNKGRRSKRQPKVYPTLSNVDLIEYERWLAERISANIEAFERANAKFMNPRSKVRYKGFSSNEAEKVQSSVGAYLDAVRKIRIGLVKVRQQIKMEFK